MFGLFHFSEQVLKLPKYYNVVVTSITKNTGTGRPHFLPSFLIFHKHFVQNMIKYLIEFWQATFWRQPLYSK